ncbi:MAG: GAF domain-containing protein [Pseudomonadota bacterium]|nr:MAG: GAF domain-containing protein [Pseudomonadota bacterium]
MPKALSYPFGIAALGLGYFLAGQVGLAIDALEPGHAAGAIWPPAGVALAVLLRFGIGLWPGVALGSALVTWEAGHSGGEIVAAILSGTLMALAGAWLLSRSARFNAQLRHVNHALALTFHGGVVAGLVGAGIVAFGVLFAGADSLDALSVGLFGWLGNASGVLLMAPLVLLWVGDGSAWRLPHPAGETIASLVLLALATAIGFGLLTLGEDMGLPLGFAPVPLLVWIALRLPLRWSALAVALTVLIAGIATANGHGPFALFRTTERQLLLWTFATTVGMTTLLLGIAVDGKRRAIDRLRQLARVVERIGAVRSLRELTTIVCRATRELTGADGVTFVLRQGAECNYVDEDAVGPLWKGQRVPLESYSAGWGMPHEPPVVIEDVYADPRLPHEHYRATFVRSLAMVPIGHGEPRGAIGSYWSARHRASSEELALAQAVAEAAAVGLGNIDLYQRLDSARRDAETAAAELRASEPSRTRCWRDP